VEASKTSQGDQPSPTWSGLLKSAAASLVPVLITAGSLIGFVAFSGAVIVWTRFSAAEVPADQAVNAVPREELVAIGSSLLLLFGFFGVLAVVAVFLIDRGGRVTPGMSRGLLLLLAIEGVAAIMLVEGGEWQRRVLAGELFVLPMAVILWSTFSGGFTKLDETSLAKRGDKERDAVLRNHAFRTDKNKDPIALCLYLIVLAVVGGAIGATLLSIALGAPSLYAWMVSLAALSVVLGLAVVFREISFHRHPARKAEALQEEQRRVARAEKRKREESLVSGPPLASLKLKPKPREEEEERRPPRFGLEGSGIALVGLMLLLAAAGPSFALERWWLAASLGSAIILGAGLWRIASLANARFMWYGLAVFISVPLFGTLTAMARNIEDPQVQPMALIRNTDGPDEAIQGLYVTEADDRIYFATVATEGCTKDLSPHSGRLLWVPKAEVVAMTVGPSQDVEDAANSALEMAFALTPGSGVPGGGQAAPSAAEGQAGAAVALDKRLEGVGAAVRPNFGLGLSLVPPDASPGDVVTLRMSLPNPHGNVDGFGPKRKGRTLRLGGVPAPILRERVDKAEGAEFVKTSDGKVLALDKEGVYGRGEKGGFYLIENLSTYYRRRFLRLSDSFGAKVEGKSHARSGSYLALRGKGGEGEGEQAILLEGQTVVLKSGEEVGLKSYLLRQAWHEDHIKFRVPDDASSGTVSVECKQLAGQPVLHVARPPTARIAVRMRAGSRRVSFDGTRSSDDGRIVSRRWEIEGHVRGGGSLVSLDLPPRRSPYSVRLVVTDDDHQSDSARVRLLRLPASLFGFDKEKPEDSEAVKRISRVLSKAVRSEAPTAVELDGHTDDVGRSSYNLGLSLRRAERVRKELLVGSSSRTGVEGSVPVALHAFGENCPLDRRHGRSRVNRRVEVFILGPGTAVAPRRGCHAGKEADASWLPEPLPPP
jgi:outer membrane protein OmpA-like peptidoglycan-associated protein